MIASFRHKGLKKLYDGNPKGVKSSLRQRIEDIMFLLDNASAPEALSLPGMKLHELKGNRKGTWAVAVNANWRVTFHFQGGNACDVDLEDYH